MATIALIIKPNKLDCGVGRYSQELGQSMKKAGINIVVVYPHVPLPKKIIQLIYKVFSWDLEAFFLNYPICIRYPAADIYHLASQNLATLMIFRRPPGITLLTVHDLIKHDFQSETKFSTFHKLVINISERFVLIGIRKVDWVIMDSNFSKFVLQSYVSYTAPDTLLKLSKEI